MNLPHIKSSEVVKYTEEDYTPSDFAGSPCRSQEDGKWKGFPSCDLSVRSSSNLVSLGRSPFQKGGSWRHAFSVHAYTCCEPFPLVCDFRQGIFHHTLVPSVVESERVLADPLLHDPAYDVDVRIIWRGRAKKLFGSFDELVRN